jgi:multiple sugar transport system ATP-binding protein
MREKISKEKVDSKVMEVAELLEITDILDRYPPSISGGQQQRVSLARALVRDSDALLLDEPMSQLEPQLRAVLRARVKDYIQHNKKTVIFVTHDQTEAVALADKIAVMENGDLKQLASPYEISAKPSNVFVASFIGEPPMNILKAKINTVEEKLKFEILNDENEKTFSIKFNKDNIKKENLAKLANDQLITLGIRPHKIFFNEKESNFDGKASSSSYHWLGDQVHIGIEINGSSIIGVADRDFEPSSDVKLNFPAESINIFDLETEEVILNGL